MSKRILAVVAIGAPVVLVAIWLLAKPPAIRPTIGTTPISLQAPSVQQASTTPVEASTTTPALAVNSTASSTVDTSNWLTYRNSTYGYSFKYPPGFSVMTRADYVDYPDQVQDIVAGPNVSPKDVVKNLWLEVEIGANPPGVNAFSSEADFFSKARQDLRATCFSTPFLESGQLTDIVRESTSTTQHGISVYEAYYKFVKDGTLAANGSSSGHPLFLGIVGPFYELDISQQSHGLARILNILPAESSRCSVAPVPQAESSEIRAFIQSVSS
jgi:hypothetical protein